MKTYENALYLKTKTCTTINLWPLTRTFKTSTTLPINWVIIYIVDIFIKDIVIHINILWKFFIISGIQTGVTKDLTNNRSNMIKRYNIINPFSFCNFLFWINQFRTKLPFLTKTFRNLNFLFWINEFRTKLPFLNTTLRNVIDSAFAWYV